MRTFVILFIVGHLGSLGNQSWEPIFKCIVFCLTYVLPLLCFCRISLIVRSLSLIFIVVTDVILWVGHSVFLALGHSCWHWEQSVSSLCYAVVTDGLSSWLCWGMSRSLLISTSSIAGIIVGYSFPSPITPVDST